MNSSDLFLKQIDIHGNKETRKIAVQNKPHNNWRLEEIISQFYNAKQEGIKVSKFTGSS